MPRSYWRFVLATLGWLILAGANQPSEQRPSATSAQQAAPAPQPSSTPTPSPTASTSLQFAAYPGYNPDPCYHAKDKDAADLCAQWRAAISSEKAAAEAHRATNWAIVATVLSFIGVTGLIYTIWQTQGSLAEARRGNRIAMKANARATREAIAGAKDTANALEIARRNAETSAAANEISQQAVDTAVTASHQQLRAYVIARPAKVWLFAMDGGLYTCRVNVLVKNMGQTPAINVRSVKSPPVILPHYPPLGTFDGEWPIENGADGSRTILGANDTISKDHKITFEQAFVEQLEEEDSKIFFSGWIKYKDIFGAAQETKYCFFVKPEKLIFGIGHLSPNAEIPFNEAPRWNLSKGSVSTANQWNEVT